MIFHRSEVLPYLDLGACRIISQLPSRYPINEKHRDEILAWAQANGHGIYRLRRGSVMRFFILPQDGANS